MLNDKKKFFASFFLGVFVGGLLMMAGTRLYHCYWRGEFYHREHLGMKHHKLLNEFTKKLNLNDEQKKRIESILDAKRQKIQSLRQEIHPKFRELRESARSEIRLILTPEQQSKFDQITEEHNQRWEQKYHH